MATEQGLVVTDSEAAAESAEKNTATPFGGAGGVENAYGTYQAIVNGDWDTAGLSAMGTGVDIVGFAADPLGSLASWGVGWLIENVSFLRDGFDALMGDPDAISGLASTWENVGKELKSVADEYGHAVDGTTAWEGKAGDAYRSLGTGGAATIDALSALSSGMKAGVEGAGVVVGAVRGIVRDLIAGAIGEIVSAVLKWGVAAVCTAGIAVGGAIADAVRIALKWADKISEWMNKLADSLKNLSRHLEKLGSAGTSIRKNVDAFFNNISNAPSGNLVKVQGHSISKQGIENTAGTVASSGSKLGDAWTGFKAGGAEYKPFASGDIFKPHLDMGPDGGASKLGYEIAKETAKLDDGKETNQEQQPKE